MFYPFLLILLTAIFVVLAIFLSRILRSDPQEYELNRRRFDKPLDTLRGKGKIVTTSPIPDGRTHAGLVLNKKTGKLELQGALSQEAINKIVCI